jgi:uncharacterized repeat protein (TIGR03803 family)
VVHEFPAALAVTPKYLALSKDGNVYGATSAVGLSNGTVFRLSGGSAYTTLATLDYARDGGPFRAPFLGTGGLLYGTTYYGGSHGDGNAYRLSPGGTFTNIVSCTLHSCLYPIDLVIGADGNVYIHHPGWVYQLTPAGAFHLVATFNGKDGTLPDELTLGADGNLYGTTEAGGSTSGGVLFKLTLPH